VIIREQGGAARAREIYSDAARRSAWPAIRNGASADPRALRIVHDRLTTASATRAGLPHCGCEVFADERVSGHHVAPARIASATINRSKGSRVQWRSRLGDYAATAESAISRSAGRPSRSCKRRIMATVSGRFPFRISLTRLRVPRIGAMSAGVRPYWSMA